MANLERYRRLVRELLAEDSRVDFSNPELETELIFGLQCDHYQIVHVGWSNKRQFTDFAVG